MDIGSYLLIALLLLGLLWIIYDTAREHRNSHANTVPFVDVEEPTEHKGDNELDLSLEELEEYTNLVNVEEPSDDQKKRLKSLQDRIHHCYNAGQLCDDN